jgi:branched-chain amino acid transport system ATP-binding protein
MKMLEVDNVDIYYGDLQVIWNVSLDVNEGEIVSVIGSNGAGKSTLLKAISGIIPTKSGTIKFESTEIQNKLPHNILRLGIAQVPEGRRLFPRMSVVDNLLMGGFVKEARSHKEESFDLVYSLFPILMEREDQKAGTLSGGEQQMLAIGRALMSRPKLLMLDEPSLGLAPKLVLDVLNLVKEIRKKGVTVMIIEQNVQHALNLADRGYVLETGSICRQGTSEVLLKDEYVKECYLGG